MSKQEDEGCLPTRRSRHGLPTNKIRVFVDGRSKRTQHGAKRNANRRAKTASARPSRASLIQPRGQASSRPGSPLTTQATHLPVGPLAEGNPDVQLRAVLDTCQREPCPRVQPCRGVRPTHQLRGRGEGRKQGCERPPTAGKQFIAGPTATNRSVAVCESTTRLGGKKLTEFPEQILSG